MNEFFDADGFMIPMRKKWITDHPGDVKCTFTSNKLHLTFYNHAEDVFKTNFVALKVVEKETSKGATLSLLMKEVPTENDGYAISKMTNKGKTTARLTVPVRDGLSYEDATAFCDSTKYHIYPCHDKSIPGTVYYIYCRLD